MLKLATCYECGKKIVLDKNNDKVYTICCRCDVPHVIYFGLRKKIKMASINHYVQMYGGSWATSEED